MRRESVGYGTLSKTWSVSGVMVSFGEIVVAFPMLPGLLPMPWKRAKPYFLSSGHFRPPRFVARSSRSAQTFSSSVGPKRPPCEYLS